MVELALTLFLKTRLSCLFQGLRPQLLHEVNAAGRCQWVTFPGQARSLRDTAKEWCCKEKASLNNLILLLSIQPWQGSVWALLGGSGGCREESLACRKQGLGQSQSALLGRTTTPPN